LKIIYYNEELILKHIAESLVFSGFPMSTNTGDLEKEIQDTYFSLKMNENNLALMRGRKLGSAHCGGGHDCFLKGIIVNSVIQAPQYFWQQIKRYHFFDIISSQSTMHRLTQMNLSEQCNSYVDNRIIEIVTEYIDKFEETNDKQYFKQAISNLPSGFNLTAGITTNYLQLKTIENQRRNHKLDEWSIEFMDFIDNLPFFKILTKTNDYKLNN